ncbi:hypothetical protein PBI_RICH_51 [Mycobacterium phage Rich]|uniref:Uncharacterized protein n=1 Tax=Mycobacterium phage Rich TaxID=1927021 RepID=A0A1L6BZ35_9CAUD|nr:hypothetical protein PBI_RICH_51 [Mycobacterium phage Rich]
MTQDLPSTKVDSIANEAASAAPNFGAGGQDTAETHDYLAPGSEYPQPRNEIDMTTATRMTVRQFISANLADGVTNYHDEAVRLAALIPDADKDTYLAQAIIGLITDLTGQRRRDAFDAALTSETDTEESHNEREDQRCPAPSVSQNFARNEAHRAFWLELRDSIGLSADGGRMRVGDMTAADLKANIVHREKLAAENQHRAEQFRRLLGMLETAGVETVDQIGADQ